MLLWCALQTLPCCFNAPHSHIDLWDVLLLIVALCPINIHLYMVLHMRLALRGSRKGLEAKDEPHTPVPCRAELLVGAGVVTLF